MELLSFALHALSAYFGMANCNTGCGRKPQNQYSIHLLAPIDIGKSFSLLLISNAPYFQLEMKFARDVPNSSNAAEGVITELLHQAAPWLQNSRMSSR
jgi:hypothetical protein